MELLVGLGNPGKEYEHTRHNVAWIVLRSLMAHASFPDPHNSSACSGEVSDGTLYGKEVRVLFPTTFMNNSGTAVKKTLGSETSTHLVVVHDEIDLPFGTVRVVVSRGAGGHNGVKSIIEHLGSPDFVRIRIGIGKKNIFGIVRRPTGEQLSNFVLGEFGKSEAAQLPDIEQKVARALELIYTKGVQEAMGEVNAN